jgi:outer membrane protein, heavy metal efflux system
MRTRHIWRALAPLAALASACQMSGQKSLTWHEVRERFEASNPTLLAGKLTIDESKANEITAGLRPNPDFALLAEQFQIFNPHPLQPFQNTQITSTVSQLFERRKKRPLRMESTQLGTSIASADQQDLERTLLFELRDAFLRILQAKALLELAADNLKYYDRVIETNRQRLQAGDISRSDFARIELQRAQFESDFVNAQVNLRTAKIQLLALLQSNEPVDRFDVTGEFDFREPVVILDELHKQALAFRPDLQSAATTITKAQTDNRLAYANGSADPTVGLEYQRTGPYDTAGFSFAIPIRVFDRNQGEKARTAIEIQRVSRLRQALEASIVRDVDSAYAALQSTIALLRPYRDNYIPEAQQVREYIEFAYRNGAASLLDFLDAEKSYRDIQLNYRNLVGSYLSAVNQLNLAVGREVIP